MESTLTESLRRADHSSRGVLPTMVRSWVWSRNLVNYEALAHWGAVAPNKTNRTKTELQEVVLMEYVNNL